MTTKAKVRTGEWMSAVEVSNFLDISPNTVRRMPPEQLPYLRLGKRGDRRYRLVDVEAYVERNTVR